MRIIQILVVFLLLTLNPPLKIASQDLNDSGFYIETVNDQINTVKYAIKNRSGNNLFENESNCRFEYVKDQIPIFCNIDARLKIKSRNCSCNHGILLNLNTEEENHLINIYHDQDVLISDHILSMPARAKILKWVVGLTSIKFDTNYDVSFHNRRPNMCQVCILRDSSSHSCCKHDTIYSSKPDYQTCESHSVENLKSNTRYKFNLCDTGNNLIISRSFETASLPSGSNVSILENIVNYHLSYSSTKIIPTTCSAVVNRNTNYYLQCIESMDINEDKTTSKKTSSCTCTKGAYELPRDIIIRSFQLVDSSDVVIFDYSLQNDQVVDADNHLQEHTGSGIERQKSLSRKNPLRKQSNPKRSSIARKLLHRTKLSGEESITPTTNPVSKKLTFARIQLNDIQPIDAKSRKMNSTDDEFENLSGTVSGDELINYYPQI